MGGGVGGGSGGRVGSRPGDWLDSGPGAWVDGGLMDCGICDEPAASGLVGGGSDSRVGSGMVRRAVGVPGWEEVVAFDCWRVWVGWII